MIDVANMAGAVIVVGTRRPRRATWRACRDALAGLTGSAVASGVIGHVVVRACVVHPAGVRGARVPVIANEHLDRRFIVVVARYGDMRANTAARRSIGAPIGREMIAVGALLRGERRRGHVRIALALERADDHLRVGRGADAALRSPRSRGAASPYNGGTIAAPGGILCLVTAEKKNRAQGEYSNIRLRHARHNRGSLSVCNIGV